MRSEVGQCGGLWGACIREWSLEVSLTFWEMTRFYKLSVRSCAQWETPRVMQALESKRSSHLGNIPHEFMSVALTYRIGDLKHLRLARGERTDDNQASLAPIS